MENPGYYKVAHGPEEVEEIAERIDVTVQQLRAIAAEMREIGLPEFVFAKKTVLNRDVEKMELWMTGLMGDWAKQKAVFLRARAMRDKRRAAEAPPQKTTRKKKSK